jgi:anhydro-N-acetylmuramic acid kinase
MAMDEEWSLPRPDKIHALLDPIPGGTLRGALTAGAGVRNTFVPRMEHPAVIGVMSGSSLDGIDLALCRFRPNGAKWSFTLVQAETLPFPAGLRDRLLHATAASGLELARLHRDLGRAFGTACKAFAAGTDAALVASHGHTVFHQPDEGLTVQVGCGAQIAALSGLPVVCDLRTKDVALGGQGAPLVPFGEQLLFPEHSAFVNLGGIANLSVHGHGGVIGYDVCPCNQALDLLAAEAGLAYDQDGGLARSGALQPELLAQLDALPFYAQEPPRSLGREWFEAQMAPLITGTTSVADRLRTVTEHIAGQVAKELARSPAATALFTGGGTHNGFLLERIAGLGPVKPVVPSGDLINFKEAVIFAFLGLMRWEGRINTLASVTGATQDSIGGAIYLPN